MHGLPQLRATLTHVAGLTEADWQLLLPDLTARTLRKGDFFNRQGTVCEYLGFLVSGAIRAYYPATKNEANTVFFLDGDFVVAYLSFVTQTPCHLNLQALEASELLLVPYASLQRLYGQSHGWERFGRRVAELAFIVSQQRVESFLFATPEERYLALQQQRPDICERVPLYHLASFLGIAGPSLSRIRHRQSSGLKAAE